jgi:hypothetical protein
MGYTQYYPQNRDFTDKEWNNISDAFQFLFRKGLDEEILTKHGTEWSEPYQRIRFDGVGDGAHETFILNKNRGHLFSATTQFCKTARKPYDKYVTAILSIADYYASGALRIQSDGYSICRICKNTVNTCEGTQNQVRCWLPGILLATEVCGITHMPKANGRFIAQGVGIDGPKPEE